MSLVTNEDGLPVIKPARDIVASCVEEIRAELLKIATPAVSSLAIDLSGVGMLDSVGIGLLIATHNTLSGRGGKLILRNASPDIVKLLKVMRLDRHFSLEA